MASSFRRAQCLLMVSADPHPYAAPYPNTPLWVLHGRRLEMGIYHFQECSARAIRDCVLVDFANRLLTLVEDRARGLAEAMEERVD